MEEECREIAVWLYAGSQRVLQLGGGRSQHCLLTYVSGDFLLYN